MNFAVSATPRSSRSMLVLACFLVLLLTAVALFVRPMMPIDETRYISVAWEMWLRGDYLVPFKNGAPYSHKPPLMMWLFQAGWTIFGVNEWWPRLVSPLFSVANLFLTASLARRLWPERGGIDGPAALILASGLLWTFFSTAAMFDILLAFFTLVAMHGTLMAAHGKTRRGIACLSLAIGLGVLTKGPVILLDVLPPALLAPWWKPDLRPLSWYAKILVAVVIGAAIALAWAIPAAIAGGKEYGTAIFLGQTADRLVESFAHRRPFWWYLPLLPVLVFPWLIWPGLWRVLALSFAHGCDRGLRFCIAWALPTFVAFCLISGKQPHYLLPLVPAFALLAARAIVDDEQIKGLWLPVLLATALGVVLLAMGNGIVQPPRAYFTEPLKWWPGLALIVLALAILWTGRHYTKPVVMLALLGVAVSALVQFALLPPIYGAYDVRPMALAIREAQEAGHPIVHLGDYNDQYHFAGRLRTPLTLVGNAEALKALLVKEPNAYAVIYPRDLKAVAGVSIVAGQRYLDGAVVLVDAPSALTYLARPKAPAGAAN